MAKRQRKNDGYQAKVEFWEDQLALAKQAKEFALVDHARYSIERCEESLAYFKGKRAAYLAKHGETPKPRTQMHKIIEDDLRDIAIQVVDLLIAKGHVPDCTDTDDPTEFEVQDIIVEGLKERVTPTETPNPNNEER